MKRLIVLGLVVLGLASLTGTAVAHHTAKPPAQYDSITFIQNAYPGLYQAELAKPVRNWNRLRRAAKTAWMHSHPCLNGALQWRYKLNSGANRTPPVFKIRPGVSWGIVERTWQCDNVPQFTRRVMRCIVDLEGGKTWPDVWFTPQSIRSNGGNLRGYVNGLASNGTVSFRVEGTNTVEGHGQVRPYHSRRAHPNLANGDQDRTVTQVTHNILSNPVDHGRIIVDIFNDRPTAYATYDNALVKIANGTC